MAVAEQLGEDDEDLVVFDGRRGSDSLRSVGVGLFTDMTGDGDVILVSVRAPVGRINVAGLAY